MIERRALIAASLAAGAGLFVPDRVARSQVADGPLSPTLSTVPEHALFGQRILVLVELNGGNDGLNTIVPYGDPLYAKARPGLAIPRQRVVPIDETIGFYDALSPILPDWQEKRLAVVLGVGYPDPNRSHFRSIEIWDTASNSDEIVDDGWVSRIFAQIRPPRGLPADGLALGRDAGPLTGGAARVLVLDKPERALAQARNLPETGPRSPERTVPPALAHVLSVRAQVKQSATEILKRSGEAGRFEGDFPNSEFGRQLQAVSAMLAGGIHIPVIKVRIGSFDTHANQMGQHTRLLNDLAQGLAAFRTAMQSSGLWNDILVMTYAEFGRRVAENASGGTDHGTAAPHFVMGGRVTGGIYGAQPRLDDLDAGDLRYTVHMRDYYASAVEGWWRLRGAFPGHAALGFIDA